MPIQVTLAASFIAHSAAAFLLAWLIGYERYFHGRASGSQVYCLVSMASCAITLVAGFPDEWYGQHAAGGIADPTRVIGSVLTGIGFLGAGIIVKSGTNVRGLTTAASIWSSAAVGILVGVDFFGAALGLTLLYVACMIGVPRLEVLLPAHPALAVTLKYREDYRPQVTLIREFLASRGLMIPEDSITLTYNGRRFEFQCLVVATSTRGADVLGYISQDLPDIPHVESFTIAHTSRA